MVYMLPVHMYPFMYSILLQVLLAMVDSYMVIYNMPMHIMLHVLHVTYVHMFLHVLHFIIARSTGHG